MQGKYFNNLSQTEYVCKLAFGIRTLQLGTRTRISQFKTTSFS